MAPSMKGAISYIKTVPDWRTDKVSNRAIYSREKSRKIGDRIWWHTDGVSCFCKKTADVADGKCPKLSSMLLTASNILDHTAGPNCCTLSSSTWNTNKQITERLAGGVITRRPRTDFRPSVHLRPQCGLHTIKFSVHRQKSVGSTASTRPPQNY